MNNEVYFISDAHLGAGPASLEKEKEARLVRFLRDIQGRATQLYILGDFFDFWFEYRTVVPKRHYEVIHRIAELIRSGTRVTYIAGNHDFWLGPFLRDQVGIYTSLQPVEASHQGLRLFICHGDGLVRSRGGHITMTRIIRSPITIWLFSLMHPDLAAAIVRVFSRWSRNRSLRARWNREEDYRAFARARFSEGFNAVVLGHSHTPALEEADGNVYINVGDWIRQFTYARLSGGRLTLQYYQSPCGEARP